MGSIWQDGIIQVAGLWPVPGNHHTTFHIVQEIVDKFTAFLQKHVIIDFESIGFSGSFPNGDFDGEVSPKL